MTLKDRFTVFQSCLKTTVKCPNEHRNRFFFKAILFAHLSHCGKALRLNFGSFNQYTQLHHPGEFYPQDNQIKYSIGHTRSNKTLEDSWRFRSETEIFLLINVQYKNTFIQILKMYYNNYCNISIGLLASIACCYQEQRGQNPITGITTREKREKTK